jgi:hypothetical protein
VLSSTFLTDAQQAGITRLYEADRTLFVGGLGFGKCVVGLTAITELVRDGTLKRVLVMAPLRVVASTWMPEGEKWDHLDPRMMVSAVGGAESRRKALQSDAPIVCVNFESAKQLIAEAKELKVEFDGFLIDELSCMKGCGGELFKVLRHWVKKIRWRVGMTATPVAESAEDMYAQALLLDDGKALGTRYEVFQNQWFIQSDYKGYSWVLREGAAEAITGRLKGLVYRADDSAYLAALPELIDEMIDVPLSANNRALYDEMQNTSVIKDLNVVAKNAAVCAGKLAQLASGGLYRGDERELVWADPGLERLSAVQWYVRRHRHEPVIITYQYAFQLDALKSVYPDAPVLGVGGDCSADDLIRFNAGEIPVLLGHPKSFGMGLNLQGACRTMIHYSPMYSADRYRQCIGRIHRRGQTQEVKRVSFYAPGTVEEGIIAALGRKERDEASFMLHL